MLTPLKLFFSDEKDAAIKVRAPCSKCNSEQMQLLNGYEEVSKWLWKCRSCRKIQLHRAEL